MLLPSYGSVLSCFIFGNIFLLYLYISTKKQKSINIHTFRLVAFAAAIVMIRMFFPCNFFFTYDIKSKKILTRSWDFLIMTNIGNLTILNILIIIAIVGTILKLALLIYRQYHFYKLIHIYPEKANSKANMVLTQLKEKHQITKEIHLIETSLVQSPCITGLWHPTILLPNLDFSNRELYYILEHELQHYRHHDLWILMGYELFLCAQWWNPLCYLLKAQLQQMLEILNDRTITENFTLEICLDYMKCLLKIASTSQTQVPCGAFFCMESGASLLEQRFYCLMSEDHETKSFHFSKISGIALIAICLFISTFLAFEPDYDIPKDVLETTVGLEKNRTFFIKRGETYDVYYDGSYFSSVDDLDSFPGYKVYSSKTEAQKYEKFH